jgi:putative PIN family toxin of toxin-antitoxin system
MSPATLAELEAVLVRPRLRALFDQAGVNVKEFLAEFQELAEVVEPDATDIPFRDESDRIFLDLVATHPPVEFFITGDRDFDELHHACQTYWPVRLGKV